MTQTESNEPTMRVYRLSNRLRKLINGLRQKRRQTLRTFLSSAVSDELPDLAQTLLDLGIENQGKTRPARWPMEDETLKALANASKQTGVPQNHLLLA